MHGGVENKVSVLFVCLGNICRSPMAEGAFRAAAHQRGLVALIDSAGTASYHVGSPPDPRAIAVAAKNGIDIGSQSARQIERDDFNRFTHIIALDRANLETLRSKAPRDTTAQLTMLMDAVDGRRGEPVPDPYYGTALAFEITWSQITLGVEAWVDRLMAEADRQQRA
jgi:protein-tyrosine phosphatase